MKKIKLNLRNVMLLCGLRPFCVGAIGSRRAALAAVLATARGGGAFLRRGLGRLVRLLLRIRKAGIWLPAFLGVGSFFVL